MPAKRGCALPSGIRLRALADVFAYAAEGVTLRMDATEIRVHRPPAGRCGRTAFVSGKAKQNTIKTTLISDADGAMLWCGAHRPGRMHDATAVTTEGIEAVLCQYPQVKVLVDTGYRGLATTHPDQAIPPPLKPRPETWPEYRRRWKTERNQQSSQPIPVEHAIAELRWWRQLQRYTARRQLLPETINAIAGLVSDRALTW